MSEEWTQAPFTLSDDGRTLTWNVECSEGTRKGSIRWDHDPTEDELRFAVENCGMANRSVELPGQGNSIRRLWGGWFVYHSWGPPTWWLPRPSISWRKGVVGIGWFTHAFALTRARSHNDRTANA
jgi:hypothetical protein